MDEAKFIIIDTKKQKSLYGQNQKTMKFSTREVAYELGYQLFGSPDDFMIIELF